MDARGGGRTSGLSLLEVLIAIMIVGIIAAAVLPMIGDWQAEARSARILANLKQIEVGVTRYHLAHKAPWGFVYDPSGVGGLIAYKHAGLEGFANQLQEPTDVYGNVLGDPVGSLVGPFSYGPYVFEAFVPVPASLLLGAKPKKNDVVPKGFGAYTQFAVTTVQRACAQQNQRGEEQDKCEDEFGNPIPQPTFAHVTGRRNNDDKLGDVNVSVDLGVLPPDLDAVDLAGSAIAGALGRPYEPNPTHIPPEDVLKYDTGASAVVVFTEFEAVDCGDPIPCLDAEGNPLLDSFGNPITVQPQKSIIREIGFAIADTFAGRAVKLWRLTPPIVVRQFESDCRTPECSLSYAPAPRVPGVQN